MSDASDNLAQVLHECCDRGLRVALQSMFNPEGFLQVYVGFAPPEWAHQTIVADYLPGPDDLAGCIAESIRYCLELIDERKATEKKPDASE